ncbi:E3 ubiquitin-protein ligase Midline-1-like [Mytilus californianus]|uniref:E3 ubiquitin-protein ligase Midline-1-like n=1 Tax=Mytilus californianus TaxID=6549 RepID=UPI002247047C|nr:E3 ubiquitin-protein ligase Midline-1-like [Mytilus californianus]
MASSQICGPCKRMDKSASAVKYCTDCEDPLCTDCIAIHKAIKVLVLHHLVDAEFQADKAFSIRRTCSDHPDMGLEFYCSNHESLCCRICSVNTHRTCGKILPIDVAARGIKTSVMLNDVTADLKALLKTAEKLEENRTMNKENIGKAKVTTLQEIAQFKRELIQELDELEKKLMTDVDVTEKKLTRKAESDLSDIATRKKVIANLSEQLEFLTKHGSESQILMLLKTIRVDISKQENDFQNLVPSYVCIDVNFKASGIKSALNSLGSMEIKYVPCLITLKPSKHAQAQIPQEYEKMPTKFKLKNEFKLPYINGRISSIVVPNDNRLLLCYWGDKSKALSIWFDTGDHIQECALAGAAWGIAIIQGTNEAVVTLPSIDSIQFVNITSMFPGKVMEVPDKPYGVTIVKNMIVLGGAGKVYFLTMTGSLMKTFNVGSGKLYSLKTGEMDMIYCCEADKDRLHCIDINGTVIFSYASPDVIGPADIALDGKENIYVTICTSNELHRLSPDGKLLDILLNAEDGLNKPCGIAFNKNYTKLYIANGPYRQNKHILIFDCA